MFKLDDESGSNFTPFMLELAIVVTEFELSVSSAAVVDEIDEVILFTFDSFVLLLLFNFSSIKAFDGVLFEVDLLLLLFVVFKNDFECLSCSSGVICVLMFANSIVLLLLLFVFVFVLLFMFMFDRVLDFCC